MCLVEKEKGKDWVGIEWVKSDTVLRSEYFECVKLVELIWLINSGAHRGFFLLCFSARRAVLWRRGHLVHLRHGNTQLLHDLLMSRLLLIWICTSSSSFRWLLILHSLHFLLLWSFFPHFPPPVSFFSPFHLHNSSYFKFCLWHPACLCCEFWL